MIPNVSPIGFSDFYKTDHRRQMPSHTDLVYSNLTGRQSRNPEESYYVVFGIQYFIKEYLIRRFQEDFFSKPRRDVVRAYKRRLDNALGKDAVPMDHVEALHKLGYLPLLIKALPEGTRCPIGVPAVTIVNTLTKFSWLTNHIETMMSNSIWGMINSATTAHRFRKMLDKRAELSSSTPEFVDWQGHDFSMRGMFGMEAACMSGAGHLLSFTGTDTIPAIDFLEMYYNANSDTELIGGSVPATEHSVMCMGTEHGEEDTILRLITKVYPKGNISIVSDTWDFWKVLTTTIQSPRVKEAIMRRDGKVIFRPDSGDPVKIVCGDSQATSIPALHGAVECLWNGFGGTVNSKGYRELDSHVGLIYGDSITYERADSIGWGLMQNNFASTNVVFGIGSYTYQYTTRDQYNIAIKATYGEVAGEGRAIWKDPKTDTGMKKSHKGLLMVTPSLGVRENVSWVEESTGALQPVFLNGKLEVDVSLREIRKRLRENEK